MWTWSTEEFAATDFVRDPDSKGVRSQSDKNRWSLPRPKPRGALLGTEKLPLLLLEKTIAHFCCWKKTIAREKDLQAVCCFSGGLEVGNKPGLNPLS